MIDTDNLEVRNPDLPGGLDGDCFGVACGLVCPDTTYLRQLHHARCWPWTLGPKSPFRIVHGLPVGQGRYNDGLRFWHAWLELTPPRTGNMLARPVVLDFAGGNETRVDRVSYYRIGQLADEHVWRYTPAEAIDLFAKSGHCGPWPYWEGGGSDWIEAMANVNEGRA
jgi:hypothetical protein